MPVLLVVDQNCYIPILICLSISNNCSVVGSFSPWKWKETDAALFCKVGTRFLQWKCHWSRIETFTNSQFVVSHNSVNISVFIKPFVFRESRGSLSSGISKRFDVVTCSGQFLTSGWDMRQVSEKYERAANTWPLIRIMSTYPIQGIIGLRVVFRLLNIFKLDLHNPKTLEYLHVVRADCEIGCMTWFHFSI